MIDEQFITRLLGRERATIARAISIVESGNSSARKLLDAILPHTGKAYRVGITGPPGAGKSTLAGELTRLMRQSGCAIAIVAVDPTSPFTSGALLGDRVRMADLDSDGDVFIRSMATRGAAGGLSATTGDVVDILDAAGFEYIFVESTGVGQTELDVRHLVDTTIVVLVPEAGDQVQAAKAGLMEIADIFVLNKCDRQGSSTALQSLQSAVGFRNHGNEHWQTGIIETVASEATGVELLAEEISRHRASLGKTDKYRELLRARAEQRLQRSISEAVNNLVWSAENRQYLADALPQIMSDKVTPDKVVAEICSRIKTLGQTR